MKIHNHNVFEPWPLEDKSVQAIITSPPYFGLRKYDIPDIIIGDWRGQYGLEPSVELYVENTLLWCVEVMRVLKDDGVFFLNLGDSYGGSWGNYGSREGKQRERSSEFVDRKGATPSTLRPPMTNAPKKCKLLVPHRVAIALCDEIGLILRNDIVWHKKNSMPESMQDRFSRRFENIFMFSKSQKYYFDLDAVKEPYETKEWQGEAKPWPPESYAKGEPNQKNYKHNMKGKNPSDVWDFTTQPSPFEHYAMWPEKLVERMIRCSTRPEDTILDPFAGSGTTIRVAEQLNRRGIGFDLGYTEIQEKRLSGIQKELGL